jgi:hypothetical protein
VVAEYENGGELDFDTAHGGRQFEILVIAVFVLWISSAVYYRREIRAKWRLWRLRNGHGTLDSELVEHLFFRVAGPGGEGRATRVPAQTWREWGRTFQIPTADPS